MSEYADKGKFWQDQIDHADAALKTWRERGDMVVQRYRDERVMKERGKSKFNILWSNVQVLTPSLYGRPAKPEVSRRFKDSDPVGRLASTMLERVIDYETQQFPDFDAAMRGCVEDRLLPGRGTAWIRFDPTYGEERVAEGVTPVEKVDKAHSPVDYVYWKDFLHSPARTWDEVWWVAKRSWMTRDKGVERFGSVFKNVKLEEYPDDETGKSKAKAEGSNQQAQVWEIWNKRDKTVCWIAKNYPQSLDEKADPLELEGFFPCPKPLYATMTSGSTVPVPDYCEYQDQADELDSLTGRIDKLVKAIKAVGVYNKEFKELSRLLEEGVDNRMFGVDNWAALSEKNGLKGNVELLDLTTQLQALGALYTAREQIKQAIYEICGISDILRGQTKAEETLGAQQLKANFGSLRLRTSQTDVARFASEVFRLKAQVICKFYPHELIVQMSGVAQTSEGADPEILQQALQILHDSTIRDFHINVESDSLAQVDAAEEKAAAGEAITAIGGFVREAIPMVQSAPETLPMVSEMLLFLVRRFHAGRGLESAIENAMKALQQKAAQAAQNPQKSEAEIEAETKQKEAVLRAQVDTQAHQMKAQLDSQVQQGKLQQEMQLETLKMQLDKQRESNEAQLEMVKVEFEQKWEWMKAQLEARTKIEVANIGADAQREAAERQAEAAKEAAKNKPQPAGAPA